jgi:molybdopterin-guanine dinucleotide biosynthesis protein A
MSQQYRDVTGYVIAGGRSERLGQDKRRLTIGGMTLLQRACNLLNELLRQEPFVVGDNLAGFGIDGSRIISDAAPNCGPLGGLVAALENCSSNWSLVLAVDLPLMQFDDLSRLINVREEQYDLHTLCKNDLPEPLAAIYHKRTLEYWRDRLQRGELGLIDGIRQLKWNAVTLPSDSKLLVNLNNPDDLKNLDLE